MRPTCAPRRALTKLELLVVISILGLLMGLAIPAVFRARLAAQRTACKNNLRQIGIALHAYAAEHGSFPEGSRNNSFPHGSPRLTWLAAIYPYLEQGQAYGRIDFSLQGPSGAVWEDNSNSQGPEAPTAAVSRSLLCPSDGLGGVTSTAIKGTWAHSNYLAFVGDWFFGSEGGERTAFGYNYGARLEEIRDGLSNTMIVGEYLTGVPQGEAPNDFRGVLWHDNPGSSQLYTFTTPNSPLKDIVPNCHDRPDLNLPCEQGGGMLDTATSRSRHDGGVHVLLADGTVRFVDNQVRLDAWRAMASIASGDREEEGSHETIEAGPGRVRYIRDQFVGRFARRDGNTANLARQLADDVRGIRILQVYESINGFAVRIPPHRVEAVVRHPSVWYVEKDQVMSVASQIRPPNLERIGAFDAHSTAARGQVRPVNVAVVDSGVAAHPDLNIVFNRAFGSFAPNADDQNGHGTHCAGVIAAKDNSVGVVGVAPGAMLWNFRVLDALGSGTLSDFLTATNQITIFGPGQIQVVNMSVGFAVVVPTADAAVAQAVNAGIVVVVAAGNSGVDASTQSPSGAPGAICVAALDTTGPDSANRFAFPWPSGFSFPGQVGSNWGARVDFIAPGVQILSTYPVAYGSYQTESGTSMAAPHAAGLAALIKANRPNYNPAQVRALMARGAMNAPPRHQHRFPGPDVDPSTGAARIYYLINARVDH